MDSGKRALWRRFIEIAQPYFFPNVRGGRWATLLLMSGLLVALFALLTVVAAGVALAVGHSLRRWPRTSPPAWHR